MNPLALKAKRLARKGAPRPKPVLVPVSDVLLRRLQDAMLGTGLTQAEIAYICDVSTSTVNKVINRGRHYSTTAPVLKRLEHGLKAIEATRSLEDSVPGTENSRNVE
jgi:transcriptional regulator with XRE-family HTH domain